MFMIGALLIGALCFALLQTQVARRTAPLLNVQA
jgi:hypothetical protein